MKKNIYCSLLFACLLTWALPVQAYFENANLLLVIYNEDDNQVGLDLGNVSALNRTAGSNQVLAPAGSFALADFGPVVNNPSTENDWANVFTGIFTAYTADSRLNMFFATVLPTAPEVNYGAAVNMSTGSGQVHTLLDQDHSPPNTDPKFVCLSTEIKSYDNKLNQGSLNPGGMGGFHNEGLQNPSAEPSLADLGTVGYLDMYLYQWSKDAAGNHFLPGLGADYQGIIRLGNDGSVTLNPAGVNRPPIVATIEAKTVAAGKQVSVTITAGDDDGDNLSAGLRISPATDPSWIIPAPVKSGNNYTWTATWTPTSVYVGSNLFTAIVSDGKSEGARNFTVTVTNGNAAPVLATIADQTGKVNEPLIFKIKASDSENEELTLTHTPLDGAAVSTPVIIEHQYEWTFSWIPQGTQLGTHTVTFTVGDTNAESPDASATVTITIGSNINAPSVHAPVDKTRLNTTTPPDLVIAKPNQSGATYTYDFQISNKQNMVDPDDIIAEVNGTPETTGQFITWEVSKTLTGNLDDNTWYYWRARSSDGTNYSSWVSSSFQVNVENEKPGVPVGIEPTDNAVKDTRTPTLKCGIATDPDGDILTYEFAIYPQAGPEAVATAVVDGAFDPEHPEITWVVPQDEPLADKTGYFWKVRAVETGEDGLAGDWSEPYPFSVDTDSDTSLIPTLVYPVNQEIANNRPKLQITNSCTVCEKPYYYFELIERGKEEVCGVFSGLTLVQSPGISQGQVDPPLPGGSDWETGQGVVLPQDPDFTYWKTPALKDETHYCWRVRLIDAADTENTVNWSATGTFFVNRENDPPSTPTLLSPTNGVVITDAGERENLVLKAGPSVDSDEDQITYEFRLLKDGSEIAAETIEEDPNWRIPILLDNHTTYQWQVRSYDEHAYENEAFNPDCASDWTPLAEFCVAINNTPSTPEINSPLIGSVISSRTPELSVVNAVDPDGDNLQYEFEIYNDLSFASYAFVAGGIAPEGEEITNWKAPLQLSDGMTYYWRARTLDGELQSNWTKTASFRIDTTFVNREIKIAASKKILASAADMQVLTVNDPTSPAWGVQVSIPPGAVSGDILLTIGYVNNPPAFAGGIKLVNKVFVFGPSGYAFNMDVTIRLPYTQADLNAAGVSDPTKLEIYYYNELTGEWETVKTSEIDTYGRFITFKVRHFSMYASAYDEDADSSPHDAPAADSSDSGGGMCFIASAGCAGNPTGWVKGFFGIMALFGCGITALKRNKEGGKQIINH